MKTDSRFPEPDPATEAAVRKQGDILFAAMDRAPAPALFSKKGVYGRLMDWAMKDPAFKTQLFRFVDVLPALDSPSEIVRHLQEYLGDKAVELNPAMKAGLAASSFAPGLVAGPVRANVVSMAAQFVAGATPDELVVRIAKNAAAGIATTVDLLGETVVSEGEADAFLRRNLELLDTVSAFYAKNPAPCFSDSGPRGPSPRLNLSVKISALTPEVHPADPERSTAALKERLRPILRKAAQVGAFINFDMESYKLKDLTLTLFTSILDEPEFAQVAAPGSAPARVGIALQAYLRECEEDLLGLIGWARKGGRSIGVRLVKGAYWDYETVLARQRGWPAPVWSHKAESDANYEKLTRILLENRDVVSPAFASHNVRSCAHAIVQADRLGIDPREYEFQALFGMADELKSALLETGHRVREYCAIGELLPGMAYLVRRLLENTSNEGFLRAKNAGEATREQLLRNPVEILGARVAAAPATPENAGTPAFRNAANSDFSQRAPRAAMRAALESAQARPPRKWPLVINGRKISAREFVASVNPSHPGHVIGHWARATLSDADDAVAAAVAAQPSWAASPAAERCRILERAAELMEERRYELNALEILEAGKPWVEADGDVSEAIDFCRYYAAEMRRLDAPALSQAVAGERCVQRWVPRGTGVAIAPWNFPLAILCGLTVAPVVAGNTLIMKPAEQTSVTAATFMDILTEAGLPPGVVNFLPGYGEEVGAHLVAHPGVDFVAFTGSREVGLKIWETAGRTRPGQRNLKKVVCEMGGKNALIIDNDADLDEAIPAILASAFGFSGQKCSALSRLIVLDGVHDRLVERLSAAAASLPVGDPASPGTVVGPVIDADARTKILSLIGKGRAESTLAWQGSAPEQGYFVPPTLFTHVLPGHVIATEEIFGPVLAVLRARDLDQAFAIANSTPYALTGGIFSRSPVALRRAEAEIEAGNVYLNRAITGAIVERHPFGGYRMSGGGTKAGGRGYLENFLFPKAVAENVLRRGFAPPDE